MEKVRKRIKIAVFLVAIVLILFNTIPVRAAMLPSDAFGKVSEANGKDYITKTQNFSVTIITVVQIVGTAVAVCMLIMLAIKYMRMAPEGKADVKKSATTYVIGAFILFGGVGLLQVFKGAVERILGVST